jgi:hypothetical protein
MLNNHRVGSRPSRVTVAFEDGALSFMLSKDATFEDLADRLAPLGEWHHGKPVSIEVKLAAAFAPRRTRPISDLVTVASSVPPQREGRPISVI